MTLADDRFFIKQAINLALAALRFDEIPVGALIVQNGMIIGRGFNTRETLSSPFGHAEINAIAAACRYTGEKRLQGCTLYVTLEPCPMCAGAVLESYVERIVFGAYDPKLGACGSVMNIADYPGICRRTFVKGGVLEKECSQLLTDYFKKKRIRRDG